MAPGPSAELTPAQRAVLLRVARDSIAHGFEHGRPLRVDVSKFDPELQREGASFVTLKKHGQLRGCIGALSAYQPLVQDVAEHAYAAAFSDPRFPPLTPEEFPDIEISVSVLGAPEPMAVRDEDDLLRQLEPGRDGLILEDGPYRATFLPSVWESLPNAREFVRQLKRKAGLPPDYWSDTLRVSRYRTEEFSERELA